MPEAEPVPRQKLNPWLHHTNAAALPLAGGWLIYRTLLGYRLDYPGHFLAGYGATLGALVLLTAVASERYRALTIVVGCLVCIGFGAITEATLFRIAIWDPVDFGNQSLGAVLAAAALLTGLAGERHARLTWMLPWGAAALTAFIAGCRYALG